MSLSDQQKHQLCKLLDYRDEIGSALFHIERILKEYFPEEYDLAYQHWLPQIETAINDNPKWLPRGQYSMKYTLDRIQDKIDNQSDKGVSKYIK